MNAPPPERPDWRTERISDGRTGRRATLVFPADEAGWPDWLGRGARETWARFTEVHQGRGTSVWRGTLEDGGPAYYFKTFSLRGPADRWKDLVRAPRAVRAWRNAWRVERLGFAVIRPVCLLTGRRGELDPRDVLITKEEAGGIGVRDWLRQAAPAAQRRQVLAALGREIARWHGQGLVHADLNLDNLLLAWEGGAPRFIWLDLEGVRHFPLAAPAHRRVKNLVDLNYEPRALSLADRICFWHAYRRSAKLSRDAALRLRARVASRTLHRWRKRGWTS